MKKSRGEFIVITGPMCSGKTAELLHLHRLHGGPGVLTYTSRVTKSKCISSRIGLAVPADFVPETAEEITARLESSVTWVFVDEVQFLSADMVGAFYKASRNGVNVVLVGLDLDYRGEEFGHLCQIEREGKATKFIRLAASCAVCGENAFRSQKLSGGSEVINTNKDHYEPRCGRHWSSRQEV